MIPCRLGDYSRRISQGARAQRLYGSQPRRDGRAPMKKTSTWSIHKWQPKVGWGVPAAWLTLCVVWSSTWLAIKVGLRDLPPISYAGIRFLVAILVLFAVSAGRVSLLPQCGFDYAVLAFTG